MDTIFGIKRSVKYEGIHRSLLGHKGYEIDSFFYKKEEAEKRMKEINDFNNSWDSLVNYADIEEIECC